MKITVIGGGLSGMYFALLTKKRRPEFDIEIYEQNRADDTFGFGVVFSDETLDEFLDADPESYELIRENYETVNYSASTETLVNAASRLVDELPEDTPPAEIIAHWMASAKRDDAERGVIWPEVPPEIMQESGLAWGLFPNQNILHGVTFALCYRVRPWGDDPNQCLFESYALERFPEGEEPETEWVFAERTPENWGSVLMQDFSNMEFVQKGMKSSGFRGVQPNPHQEQKVINLHRNLADWLEGRGAPKRLFHN